MSIEIEPVMKSRGIVARALFPSHMTRFAIAAALTFFPDVLMYPLEYPAPELIALSAWIWAFPSRLGFAAFVLAPFIPNPTYGYWAFNLFCVQASLSIAKAATSSSTWAGEDLGKAHKPLRLYMFVTLGICFLQVITDPGPWVALFPHMRLEPGRGAGLRLEPSQIGSLLGIYLLMLVGALTRVRTSAGAIKNTTAYVREGAAMIVATVVLTRSLTVLIVACCFLPGLFQVRRKQIALAASVGIVCLGITYMVFGDRLEVAVAT